MSRVDPGESAGNNSLTKAVILARGLGTRMRHGNHDFMLTTEQAAVADTGVKGMMPFGRPFMEYQLSALADAGITTICLVTGPEHEAVRLHYQQLRLQRLRISHAIQAQPRGTADAVLAAESFGQDSQFLVLNSDNYYPPSALAAIRRLDGPGLVAFAREALLSSGLPATRMESYPTVLTGPGDILSGLAPGGGYVSMNCWRFSPAIFAACRAIGPSPRGELELPDAVAHSMTALGQRYQVIRSEDGVLDISTRADVANVARRLHGLPVNL